jgi:hypothetical protein
MCSTASSTKDRDRRAPAPRPTKDHPVRPATRVPRDDDDDDGGNRESKADAEARFVDRGVVCCDAQERAA